jgi:hypothetical protein
MFSLFIKKAKFLRMKTKMLFLVFELHKSNVLFKKREMRHEVYREKERCRHREKMLTTSGARNGWGLSSQL